MSTQDRQRVEVPAPYTVMLTVLAMCTTVGVLVLAGVMWLVGGAQ